MQNKKINKEYENLNKDFFIIKNEKEKLNADLEEQKAEIFNYQKELSKNMKKKNNNKSNFQNDNNNYEDFNWNNISEKKTESIKYHFGQFEKKENNNINEYYDEKKDKKEISNYSNENKNNTITTKSGGLRKKNYTNFDLDKYNYNNTKITLKDLESDLSYFIAEKKKFENELLKMPEHPRNLVEIKGKAELNHKIEEAEHKINSIRMKIRNFNY